MILVWILLMVGLGSFMLTGYLRLYALKKNLLDVPNRRSSHSVPTPRGGGVAIVLVCLVGLMILAGIDAISLELLAALLGAGSWVALIGFMDDHGHIRVPLRLMAHFAGVGWALIWLGGLPPLPIFGYTLDLGWMGNGFATVYLVWLLNLYNFMDGIDGIASIEALSVCLGGVVLYLLSPSGGTEWVTPLTLLAAVGGFLLWNFPRAKIFMGDAGSGFIGLMLGVMSIHAAWVNPHLFWGWVILLGVFMVDATLTLLRRMIRGDRFFEAHCSHAYQNASRRYGSHIKVSLVVAVINLAWLLPIAIGTGLGYLDGLSGIVLGYSPLVLVAIQFDAGSKYKI